MSLFDHLAELRTRLFRAALALTAGAVVGYVLFDPILSQLIEPYCALPTRLRLETASGQDCGLFAFSVLEGFSVRIKTAGVVGLFIGGPVIFYQLWRFITPGLTRRERRLALPFVALSQLMFGIGLGFAYLVIPPGLAILLALGGDNVVPALSAQEYLSFVLTTGVAFGLVFEMPLVLVFLSLVGVVSNAGLRRARPYAIVAMVALAAVVTPTTDPVNLFFMAGPMMLFYELAILSAWLIERSRRRRREAA